MRIQLAVDHLLACKLRHSNEQEFWSRSWQQAWGIHSAVQNVWWWSRHDNKATTAIVLQITNCLFCCYYLPPAHTLHVEKNKSKHKQIYPRASSGRASTATRFSALIVSLPARNEVRYLPKVRRRVADDHARWGLGLGIGFKGDDSSEDRERERERERERSLSGMAGTAPASSSINNAGDGATGGSKSKLGHGQQSADTSSLKRKRGLFSKDCEHEIPLLLPPFPFWWWCSDMPLLWIQNIIGNCLRFRNVCIQTASNLNWNPTVVTFFLFCFDLIVKTLSNSTKFPFVSSPITCPYVCITYSQFVLSVAESEFLIPQHYLSLSKKWFHFRSFEAFTITYQKWNPFLCEWDREIML